MYQVMELDRWARQVRQTTRAEMRRLRRQRAAEPQQPPVARQLAAWRANMQLVRRALSGGVPAIERRVMQWINPKIDPNSLLPQPAPHQS